MNRGRAIFLHLGKELLLDLVSRGSKESSGEGASPLSSVLMLAFEVWGRRGEDGSMSHRLGCRSVSQSGGCSDEIMQIPWAGSQSCF